MVTKASADTDFDISRTAARWLREHGYFVAWDSDHACYRLVEEGIDRKDDKPLSDQYRTVGAAYWWAFQLIAQEGK